MLISTQTLRTHINEQRALQCSALRWNYLSLRRHIFMKIFITLLRQSAVQFDPSLLQYLPTSFLLPIRRLLLWIQSHCETRWLVFHQPPPDTGYQCWTLVPSRHLVSANVIIYDNKSQHNSITVTLAIHHLVRPKQFLYIFYNEIIKVE